VKKILFIETGGTVACLPTENGLVPLSIIPEMRVQGTEISRRKLFSLDSGNIAPSHWQKIARTIAESYNEYDGFLIIHGTDTMSYTSASLFYMLQGLDKPVILTGAQNPLAEKGGDAMPNLISATCAARDIKRGVYIVFSGNIIKACSAVKLYSKSGDAFIDTLGYAGSANSESARLFYGEWPPNTDAKGFLLKDKLCTKVFYLKITPNLSGEIIEFIKNQGYKGLLIEGYGLGGIQETLLNSIGQLASEGVRVIFVSGCVYEGADLTIYQTGRAALKSGIEDGGNMTAAHALIKLMWELGNSL
jgi:L-asparaginase